MSSKQYQNCFVVFRLDERLLGIPLDYVRRVVRSAEVTPLPKSPPWVMGLLNIQGTIVCIMDTRNLLSLDPREIELSDQFLILYVTGKQVGLVADEVIGVREYESSRITNSDDLIVESPLVLGVATAKDHVTFILDTPLIVSLHEGLQKSGLHNGMEFGQWP